VEVVGERLQRFVEPLFPFQIGCRGMLAGPHAERPTWIGARLDGRGEELMGLLQRTLEKELGRVGLEADDRAYAPSVWLGRIRSGHEEVLATLAGREDVSFGSSTIKDMFLMEVMPWSRGGGVQVLERVALGAPRVR
jgi:RNA 2',3'-cyclic 3'-phosphodiesterase